MKQRVAIARALAVNPAVLLLDEPLSALDSQTRELLLEDLIGLWRRQPFTAVYVTHNLDEAVRLGHRIVVLSRRPGVIRETLNVATPPDRRAAGDPQLEVAAPATVGDAARRGASRRSRSAERLNRCSGQCLPQRRAALHAPVSGDRDTA